LRILQVITDRDRRGAQVFAVDLAEGLARLGSTVETVALTPGGHGDLLPVRALGARRFGWHTLKELRRAALRCDVVVAHGSSTLPASVLALTGTRRPIVYRQISDPQFWASSWSRRLRVGLLLRQMDGVVALSAGMAASLRRHYRLRARPVVALIPNAAPGERFRPPSGQERAGARTALGVPGDSRVILFIGALAPEKGPDLAIAACADLPDAVLVLAGNGPQRSALEELARRCMPDRCLFTGSLDDPRVAYWSADILLSPSRSEAMPAVLIEAGLCGLASVATDVGAAGEVIETGQTGLVVPPGDAAALAAAVALLLSDAARRAEMGAAAATRCSERFTIARTAPMWLDLLRTVQGAAHRG
jgi:glycosyltransferase involved in cell wall biosynthesis